IILAINLSKGGEKMADEKNVDKPVASMTGKPNVVQTSNNIGLEDFIQRESYPNINESNNQQPKSDQNQTKDKD
ncbi:hypothetical protein ACMTZU_000821, partial [Campylobacter jejuni]